MILFNSLWAVGNLQKISGLAIYIHMYMCTSISILLQDSKAIHGFGTIHTHTHVYVHVCFNIYSTATLKLCIGPVNSTIIHVPH